jgi:hypothetical protein
VGHRADLGLVQPLPAPDHPLRAPARHPHRLAPARRQPDLPQVRQTVVLLGALALSKAMQGQVLRPICGQHGQSASALCPRIHGSGTRLRAATTDQVRPPNLSSCWPVCGAAFARAIAADLSRSGGLPPALWTPAPPVRPHGSCRIIPACGGSHAIICHQNKSKQHCGRRSVR